MTYSFSMQESFLSQREAEEIFDYIADYSRVPEWDHTIISARKVTSGRIAQGTQFDLIYKAGFRKSEICYQIIEFDRPKRLVLAGNSDSYRITDTITIQPRDQGVQVDWQADLMFEGRVAKIVPWLEKRIVADGAKTIRDLGIALKDDFSPPILQPWQALGDKLIFPGVLSFSKLGTFANRRTWRPVTARLRDKRILITGATSGLGLAAAHELAHRGASLILVGRNAEKLTENAERIQHQTGNTDIQVQCADLAEMSQVADLADRLLERGQPIDVLINNAGSLFNPRRETSEGIEASFALLLLSPYLLTTQLHPLLAKTNSARVINVSSGGMYGVRLSLGNLESDRGDYRGADAYARAKRGLVIIGERWAERWADDGISVHNMHPGWARTPGVEESLPGFARLTRRILRTPEEGADTIVWLAHASEVAQTTGLFWLDRTPHSTHLTGRTRETAAQRDALERKLQQRLQSLF